MYRVLLYCIISLETPAILDFAMSAPFVTCFKRYFTQEAAVSRHCTALHLLPMGTSLPSPSSFLRLTNGRVVAVICTSVFCQARFVVDARGRSKGSRIVLVAIFFACFAIASHANRVYVATPARSVHHNF